MALFRILKCFLFPGEFFPGNEEPSCTVLGNFQLAVTLVSCVVALLGHPAALCHVGTAHFFSEAFLDFGVSPLAEDWFSLVSQSMLGRQTHCHNCDVKYREGKKGKYSS